jgi:hypothetical protein
VVAAAGEGHLARPIRDEAVVGEAAVDVLDDPRPDDHIADRQRRVERARDPGEEDPVARVPVAQERGGRRRVHLPEAGLGEGDSDAVECAEDDLDAAMHLDPCVRDLGPEEAQLLGERAEDAHRGAGGMRAAHASDATRHSDRTKGPPALRRMEVVTGTDREDSRPQRSLRRDSRAGIAGPAGTAGGEARKEVSGVAPTREVLLALRRDEEAQAPAK